MAPQRKLFVLFVLVLALAALVPGAEAKKKRASMRAIARAPAPMPAAAPMAAMGAGRMLLEDGGEAGMEVPVEAPSKPIVAAAQVAATQATPPAAATEQPAEPVEEGAAPAPSEGEEQDRNKPAAAWAQCGGTAPSSETNATWAGPTTCEEGATCVHLSATYSQCIPIKQSRGYGCSAVYAQCGGADPGVTTAWSGAYCCPEASECVFLSNTYSQCKPCNGKWEQCGGTIPGTDVPWNGHGRASCCQPGSSCRYVNSNFYSCQPTL